MKYILLALPLLVQRVHAQDSIYVKLPSHFDTVNVRRNYPNFICAVFDKMDLPGFSLDGTISFYFNPNRSLKAWACKPISYKSLSDSLSLSPHHFLKSHTFFLILIKNDTAYFYKAKGDYMYKDYKNDVSY